MSIDSHFQITEDEEDSLRLHLPNYKGNQTMDFHIYLMEPQLHISFVTEIEGEKISVLSYFDQYADQQDMFNAAMARNLERVHQVMEKKYKDELNDTEDAKKNNNPEETDSQKANSSRYKIVRKKMPNGEERLVAVGLDEVKKDDEIKVFNINESLQKHALTIMMLRPKVHFVYYSPNESIPSWAFDGTLYCDPDMYVAGAGAFIWMMQKYQNNEDFCWLLDFLNSQFKEMWPQSLNKTAKELIADIKRYLPEFKLGNDPERVKTSLEWSWIDLQSILGFIDYCTKNSYSAFHSAKVVSSLQECTSLDELVRLYFYDFNVSGKDHDVNLSSEVTDEDLKNAWTDEYKVMYSADKKRLLKAPRIIKDYNIKEGTIVVCNKAFIWCELNCVSIPKSVKVIGSQSFMNCKNVSRIVIPNGVISVGEEAFFGCKSLETVSIPNSVTSIGDSAFCYCASLSTINIPQSVDKIADSLFDNCCNLSNIDIPENVTSIGESAFSGCVNINHINIPHSVNRIGDYAFYDCSGLSSIDIPQSVKDIGACAFCNCCNLTSLNIPLGITNIKESLFSRCYALSSIIIPDSVTAIGDEAFRDCSNLDSINIPYNVKSIGYEAFSGCTNLKSFVIPNNVTTIGECAFFNTGWWISQPDGALYLDNWLIGFKGKKPSGVYNILEGTKGVADNTFFNCSELVIVKIPDSVISIGSDEFYGCSELDSIKIPKGTKSKFEELLPDDLHDIIVEYDEGHNELSGSRKEDSERRNFTENSPCSPDLNVYASKNLNSGKNEESILNTIVTDEDLKNAWTGEYGVIYSADKKRLLKASDIIKSIVNHWPLMTFAKLHGKPQLATFKAGTKDEFKGLAFANPVDNNICFVSFSNTLGELTAAEIVAMRNDLEIIQLKVDEELMNKRAEEGRQRESYCLCKKGTLITYQVMEGTITICDNALENFAYLEKIELPQTIVIIGENAFSSCKDLTSITFNGDVTSIEKSAFEGCSNLTSIIIPKGLKNKFEKLLPADLHGKLLEYDEGRKELSASEREENARRYLNEIRQGSNNSNRNVSTIFNNKKEDLNTIVTYEDKLYAWSDKYGVMYSGNLKRLLRANKDLTIYYIRKGTVTICESAFENLVCLEKVKLTKTVVYIGDNAFSGCSNIVTFIFPDSVREIGSYAFSGCKKLSIVSIPDSVEKIGKDIFKDCNNLDFIVIPAGTISKFEVLLSDYKDKLIEYEEEKPSGVALAIKYAEAYKTLDLSHIVPYLSDCFSFYNGLSDKRFLRDNYIDNFNKQSGKVIQSGADIEIKVVRNRQIKKMGILLKRGNIKSFLMIETDNGKVRETILADFDPKYEVYNYEEELEMNHYHHINYLVDPSQDIRTFLEDLFDKSILQKKVKAELTTKDYYKEQVEVASFAYERGDISFQSLAASNGQKQVFAEMYPTMKGFQVELQILTVIEWDNGLEATIICSYYDFCFAFFATDYYMNKSYYKEGSYLFIDLSAMDLTTEKSKDIINLQIKAGMDSFSKEEDKLDSEQKNGTDSIDINNFVGYKCYNLHCPDEGVIKTTFNNVKYYQIKGVNFVRVDACIYKGLADEKDLVVPLFIKKDQYSVYSGNQSFFGIIWLSGHISGRNVKQELSTSLMINEMATSFKLFMQNVDWSCYKDLNFVLDQLPLIKMSNIYILDAFQVGDEYGFKYQTYIHRRNATDLFSDTEPYYRDTMIISCRLQAKAAKKIPSILPYFEIPFNEEGIMQGWLLNNICEFMARGWHANYGYRAYLFNTEDIDSIFRDANSPDAEETRKRILAINPKELLPDIIVADHFAVMRICYWSDWGGLFRIQIGVKKDGKSIVFGEETSEVIVGYDCGIIF